MMKRVAIAICLAWCVPLGAEDIPDSLTFSKTEGARTAVLVRSESVSELRVVAQSEKVRLWKMGNDGGTCVVEMSDVKRLHAMLAKARWWTEVCARDPAPKLEKVIAKLGSEDVMFAWPGGGEEARAAARVSWGIGSTEIVLVGDEIETMMRLLEDAEAVVAEAGEKEKASEAYAEHLR